MTLTTLAFALVKIVLILGFALGLGGALTWNDRRMSAMMQDRLGPNRAFILLPAWLARTLIATPAALAAGALFAWGWRTRISQTPAGIRKAVEYVLISSQLTILLLWVGLVLLTTWATRRGPSNAVEAQLVRIRDPRHIFHAGLATHLGALLGSYLLPEDNLGAALQACSIALAVVMTAVALTAATKVPETGFRLRLAGLLHTAADGLKMIFKEDFVPRNGDRFLHAIAPMIGLFAPLAILAVIPFGDVVCLQTQGPGSIASTAPRLGTCTDASIPMQVADLDIGILLVFAISGMGVIGAALAGWASDNKYSLLGGLRAAAQMISYEVTLGLTVVGAFMTYQTLRLDDMVRWQGSNAWGIFVQPLAFILFFVAATAETKRIPFDLPEGESEIVGYFTEYSGMKFGMFYFAEYIEVVTSSALMVTLFLGGWNLPFLHRDGITIAIGREVFWAFAMNHVAVTIIQVLTFFAKVVLVCGLQAVIRWTLPRFRYDQLMHLGWKILLPASLANILLTGIVLLAVQRATPTVQSGLASLADLSQAAVVAAMLCGIVALVRWILRPTKHQQQLTSSSTIAYTNDKRRSAPNRLTCEAHASRAPRRA